METRLDWPVVELIQFLTQLRHFVGFIRGLVKAGSIGLVKRLEKHVGLFFVAQKAGAQRFIVGARESTRHFLNLPSGPLLAEEGLCHVEFRERL